MPPFSIVLPNFRAAAFLQKDDVVKSKSDENQVRTSVNTTRLFIKYYPAVCDGTQNIKRYRYRYFFPGPNIFHTDSGTSFGTKFSWYRFGDFFPVPNFSSGTKFFQYWFRYFFRHQIFPIPVPRLFSDTNLFRCHQKNEKVPVSGISGTGTSHSATQPI